MRDAAATSNQPPEVELAHLRAQLLEERPDISEEELQGKLLAYRRDLFTDNPELDALRERAQE